MEESSSQQDSPSSSSKKDAEDVRFEMPRRFFETPKNLKTEKDVVGGVEIACVTCRGGASVDKSIVVVA